MCRDGGDTRPPSSRARTVAHGDAGLHPTGSETPRSSRCNPAWGSRQSCSGASRMATENRMGGQGMGDPGRADQRLGRGEAAARAPEKGPQTPVGNTAPRRPTTGVPLGDKHRWTHSFGGPGTLLCTPRVITPSGFAGGCTVTPSSIADPGTLTAAPAGPRLLKEDVGRPSVPPSAFLPGLCGLFVSEAGPFPGMVTLGKSAASSGRRSDFLRHFSHPD